MIPAHDAGRHGGILVARTDAESAALLDGRTDERDRALRRRPLDRDQDGGPARHEDLKDWLDLWRKRHGVEPEITVQLRPHSVGSHLLELGILAGGEKAANVVFEPNHDRQSRSILSIRDQNTFEGRLRRKRLMTLARLFRIHRYKADSIHDLTPSEDNHLQTEKMKQCGLFSRASNEVGQIIVADVAKDRVKALLEPDRRALEALQAE